MSKKRKVSGLNIIDLPLDVLKIIISYSPSEFLSISKLFCRITRSMRTKIVLGDAKKHLIDNELIKETIFRSYNITTLNVSGWTKWNDSLIQHLAKLIQSGYFKSLKNIYMRNCTNVSNRSLHILLPLIGKNLKILDLFNCKNVNYKVFGSHNPKLQSLYLGYQKISDVASESTINVLEHFFNTKLDEKPLILFPKLEKLQLFNYIGIKSLSPLLNIAKSLKYLDIRGCTGIEPTELKHISSLTSLEELHIGYKVENDTLLEIINSCTRLTALDISESPISLDVIQSISSKLPLISRIKLTKCNTINNESLSILLSNLSNLSIIDLSHCWRLTNSLFNSISKVASGNKLTKIGIYMCSLDSSKLVYHFNTLGSNNIMPVTHNEVQIEIKPY